MCARRWLRQRAVTAPESVELVPAPQIAPGDVIEDPVGRRWMRVHDVQVLTQAVSGAYSFYGTGPDDRITFEGDELVRRKRPSSR